MIYLIRMMLLTLWVMLTLTACFKKKYELTDTVEYFRGHLEKDMDYSEIVAEFGEPNDELVDSTNSLQDGLHIYQYQLGDSTQVWIGYTNKIEYACLVDKRRNLVEDILQTNN